MKNCSECIYHSHNGASYPCVECDETGSRWVNFHKPNPTLMYNPSDVAFKGVIKGADISGVKYDKDKPQWSLLPFKALTEVVEVLTYGAKKYAPDNWKKVPNAKQRYIDASFRHLTAYIGGEKLDSETGKSHLAHALCCMLFLLAFEKGEHND